MSLHPSPEPLPPASSILLRWPRWRQNKWKFIALSLLFLLLGKSIKCNCVANDPYNRHRLHSTSPLAPCHSPQWAKEWAGKLHARLWLSVIVPNYKLFRICNGSKRCAEGQRPGGDEWKRESERVGIGCWAPAINFVQRQLNAEDALYASGSGSGYSSCSCSGSGSSSPWGQRLSA